MAKTTADSWTVDYRPNNSIFAPKTIGRWSFFWNVTGVLPFTNTKITKFPWLQLYINHCTLFWLLINFYLRQYFINYGSEFYAELKKLRRFVFKPVFLLLFSFCTSKNVFSDIIEYVSPLWTNILPTSSLLAIFRPSRAWIVEVEFINVHRYT